MALRARSSILYGYEVTPLRSSLDFQIAPGGPILQATLNVGFYSLTSLLTEVVRAIQSVDGVNTYTATADRTVAGGTQNRVNISTNGSYLSLKFGTGPRVSSSCAPLLGFNLVDLTGATSYTSQNTSGIQFSPSEVGYNFLSPNEYKKVFGSKNVSASGKKETIVWNIQQFLQVQFKYEPQSFVTNTWTPFMQWAIQQRLFDFTPEITSPTIFYSVTLESTSGDSNGMSYKFTEMLPQFPFLFDIGLMILRVDVP